MKVKEGTVEESDSIHDLNKEKNESGFSKQQSFSFQKVDEKRSGDYKLPSVALLAKKANVINKNTETKLPGADFIEKILLDFGIKGKIKKVNNGPVVSLYEFDSPAPNIFN